MRERLARLALAAYPADTVQDRGPEMLSTTLEISRGSSLSFLRELVSMVLGGLQARAARTARTGTRRIITDASVRALVILLALSAWGLARQVVGPNPGTGPAWAIVIWGLLALLLIGYTRPVGVIGASLIAAIVTYVIAGKRGDLAEQLSPLAVIGVPFICCLLLAFDTQPRPRRYARALWLVPIFVLGIVLPPEPIHGFRPSVGTTLPLSYEDRVLLIVSVVALLRLPYDPRLALGCGLIWASFAASNAYGALFNGLVERQTLEAWAAALILALASTRVALMRWRSAHIE
jgi:hypothetical protein